MIGMSPSLGSAFELKKTTLTVTLAGGEDEFSAGNALPMTVDAGPDDDEVTTGPGPDVVLGGPGDDVLDLDTNNSAGTSSEVDGGTDDDELRIGRDSRATIVRGGEGATPPPTGSPRGRGP